MVRNKTILVAGLFAASPIVAGSHVFPAEGKITLAEKHELRQDRKEFRSDLKDAQKN